MANIAVLCGICKGLVHGSIFHTRRRHSETFTAGVLAVKRVRRVEGGGEGVWMTTAVNGEVVVKS